MSMVQTFAKLEASALTEEDLALSFSKDPQWFEKFLPQGKQLGKKAMAKEIKKIATKNALKKIDNTDSFIHSSMFESFETKQQENPDDDIFVKLEAGSLKKDNDPKVKANKESVKFQGKERDAQVQKEDSFESVFNDQSQSRDAISVKPQNLKSFPKDEIEYKKRLRELDFQIRELSVQKNRLKYFMRKQLQKDNDLEEQSFETRECPCCGKLISKLCFRCEHIYCNVENCPRKKKQKLNAKMLEKMKEKKKENPGERRERRSRQRQIRKKAAASRGESFHSSQQDLSSSSEQQISDTFPSALDESTLPEPQPQTKTYITRSKKQPNIPDWKMTMSDISLKESKLFLSSDEQQE